MEKKIIRIALLGNLLLGICCYLVSIMMTWKTNLLNFLVNLHYSHVAELLGNFFFVMFIIGMIGYLESNRKDKVT